LIVTNPANGFGQWIPDAYWNTVEWNTSSSWLGSLFRPQDTNYGLFLLTKTIDGISATGLLNTINLCEFDSEDELVGHVCGWIGKSTTISITYSLWRRRLEENLTILFQTTLFAMENLYWTGATCHTPPTVFSAGFCWVSCFYPFVLTEEALLDDREIRFSPQ
jgi:hypothetical protein